MGWQGSDRNAARTNTMSRPDSFGILDFETETLTQEDNLKGLALMNPQWVELAMAHTPHRRVILDMDSSESPVHGQQEGAAYNGHFECVCYHPLFLFNQFGDCEGATLRPGNVHSADGWQELLEPVVKGYQKKGLRLLFRGDAAFAKPELYEYLEQGKIGYAIRLPANQVIQEQIQPLLVNGGGMLGHWGGVKLYHLVCSCSAKKSELTGQHKCPHHLLREMACLRVGQQRTGRKVLMLPILREACLEFGRQLPLCYA